MRSSVLCLLLALLVNGYVSGLETTTIDEIADIQMPAAVEPPLISIICSFGSEPYNITSSFGTIDDTYLVLPQYDTSGLEATNITVTCMDADGDKATTWFTYTVNPPLTIDTEFYDHNQTIVGKVGRRAPWSFRVTCSGGSETSYQLHISPSILGIDHQSINVIGGSLVRIDAINNVDGNINGQNGTWWDDDDGNRQWVVGLPTLLSPINPPVAIHIWCTDSSSEFGEWTPPAEYIINYLVIPWSEEQDISPLTDIVTTQSLAPPVFEVSCQGDYDFSLARLTVASIPPEIATSTQAEYITYTLFRVTLPTIQDASFVALVTLTCSSVYGGGSIVSSSFHYTILPAPVLDSIDNVYLPAGALPPDIPIVCSLGTQPYTIGTSYGSIMNSFLILPKIWQLLPFNMTIAVTCTDALNLTATTWFTYKVNPPVNIASSLMNSNIITHVGDLVKPTFIIQCGGGSGTSYSLHMSPSTISFGDSEVGPLELSGGSGDDNSSDDGDHVWNIKLPLSSSPLDTIEIFIMCNDTNPALVPIAPVATYTVEYTILAKEPIPPSIVLSSDKVITTESIAPPPFNVTCLGDYELEVALLMISSDDMEVIGLTTWNLIHTKPTMFQVQLPWIGLKQRKLDMTLWCRGAVVNDSISTSFTYMIAKRPSPPTPTWASSTIVVINNAQPPSPIILTCIDGGTGDLTPMVIIGETDDDSIDGPDLNNVIRNDTTLTLRLPSKSLSTSATLLAYCIDSLGAKSDPYIINWCIGSSYLRCSAWCYPLFEQEWSKCTSECDGGVQFRTCSNATGTFGVSNRVCNIQTCSASKQTNLAFQIRLKVSMDAASEQSFQESLIDELASVDEISSKRFSIVSLSKDNITTVSGNEGTFVVLKISDESGSSSSKEAMISIALSVMKYNSGLHQSSSIAAQSIDFTYPLQPIYPSDVIISDDGIQSSHYASSI
jgi:hypothetical protein